MLKKIIKSIKNILKKKSLNEDIKILITPEMEENYLEDLKLHYKRVKSNIFLIIKKADYLKIDKDELLKRLKIHDKSKTSLEEKEGWIFNSYKNHSAMYKGDNEYIEKKIKEAYELHIKNNKHHIEYWKNNLKDIEDVDIIEILCDVKAYFKEEGKIREFIKDFKNNYNFSKRQIWLINSITDIIDPIKVSLK